MLIPSWSYIIVALYPYVVARAITVEFAGSAVTSESIVSGAPSPMNATTPSGFSREMSNAGSAGCIVPDIAMSRVPSGKSAVGKVSPLAAFSPMIPWPVVEPAQAA